MSWITRYLPASLGGPTSTGSLSPPYSYNTLPLSRPGSPSTSSHTGTPIITSDKLPPGSSSYGGRRIGALVGGSGGSSGAKKPVLLQMWLLISPILVLGLVVALAKERRTASASAAAALGGVQKFRTNKELNQYLCHAKPDTAALETACEHRYDKMEQPNYDLGMDRSLTDEQCDDLFPGLYLEADRSRDYWAGSGGVDWVHLEDAEKKGQARAMIYNNKLYVKSFSFEQQGTRTKAALASINEALLTAREPVPDIEFVLQTGDTGFVTGAPWALGRKENQEDIVLIPDYGFYSWPEPGIGTFIEVQDKTLDIEAHLPWAEKIRKLFWRGALMVDIRKEFVDIAANYEWGAVSDLDWLDREQVDEKLITQPEHCHYQFLGHVEGWAYSGRLKYILQCRSVVVAHKMQYLQHFHHLFRSDPSDPEQNIVILPGHHFDELPQMMDKLLEDDEWAQRVAQNGFEYWRRWLSPASTNCYWRRLIRRWAEVQNFEPVLLQNTTSFESFILLGKTHWEPY